MVEHSHLKEFLVEVHQRSHAPAAEGVWIHRASKEDLLRRGVELKKQRDDGVDLPLFGLPFAVKDNIDVAGMPTTAGCPAFSYVPVRSAFTVERLERAGAIVVGKTNLDQFATGLVGIRSPYGVPKNPFDPRYIPGGSSSGSAVAVATGMVAFALGTDTAGSGRVPAAFNNVVGLKPTRGLLGTSGVVPACRSLDCISIFARTCGDVWSVFQVARGFDAADPYARPSPDLQAPGPLSPRFRFAVPAASDLQFFGDGASEHAFQVAVSAMEALGGEAVPVSLAPFRAAADLLYDGPWVAERLEATAELLASKPDAFDPTVRSVLQGARRFSASDVFRAQAELSLLAKVTSGVLATVAALVLPTAPTIYTIDEVRADPFRLNTNLGYYTNFVNLLDLCAVAVPAELRQDGLPFGVTLVGLAGSEARLTALASRFHAANNSKAGASWAACSGDVEIAVVGAHLTGEPLNHQLVDLGACLVGPVRTAPHYKLYALANTTPAKPGLVRSPEGGAAIDMEVWRLSPASFGAFVAKVPPPLCIGTIELESGLQVHGFLCESYVLASALDISTFGGWREYRGFCSRQPLGAKEDHG